MSKSPLNDCLYETMVAEAINTGYDLDEVADVMSRARETADCDYVEVGDWNEVELGV